MYQNDTNLASGAFSPDKEMGKKGDTQKEPGQVSGLVGSWCKKERRAKAGKTAKVMIRSSIETHLLVQGIWGLILNQRIELVLHTFGSLASDACTPCNTRESCYPIHVAHTEKTACCR